MNDATINEIKNKIKGAFNFTEEQLKTFWETGHPYLGNKSPKDAVTTIKGFRQLKIMVNISVPKNEPGKENEK